jgi:hypothetical protein
VPDNIAELERQIGKVQVRETITVQQLCDENQRLQDEVLSTEIQTESQVKILQDDHELQLKRTQLTQDIRHFEKQLDEQEQMLADIRKTLNVLWRMLSQSAPIHLAQAMPMRKMSLPTQQVYDQEFQPPTRQLKLGVWKDGGIAPHVLARGAAVVEGNMAYFIHHDRVCSYDSLLRKWSKLPNFPYKNSSLAIVKGLLTAIGGNKNGAPGNKLFTIPNDKSKKWVEQFPPMLTKRSHTAAVTTKECLVVAGGKSGSNPLDAVEAMDIQSLVWTTVASVPYPYAWASAAICGEQLYVLGGFKEGDAVTKSVLTCSLIKLLQSRSEILPDSVWYRIADIPVYQSTCAAVNGELVAVGGRDAEGMTTSSVYNYNTTTNSWNVVSNMPTARTYCLVAVLPTNEMIVVGGFTTRAYSSLVDKVETVDIMKRLPHP